MCDTGAILGIGNPLLDISATVDAAFLEKYGLKANDAILAEVKHVPMYTEIVDKYTVEYIAGGATQNSIRVAQWLLTSPKSTTYIGSVGDDEFGKILADKSKEGGVNVAYYIHDVEATGTCAVLITGHDRSLCANLAAANCYSVDHLKRPDIWALVEKAKMFYSAGFFLTVSPDSMMLMCKHAADTDKIYTLNLSAPFLCQFFKEPMMKVMPYVDILFGNESEAVCFAKEQNFEETEDIKVIALKMSQLEKVNTRRSRTVVITQGSQSTIVVHDGVVTEYPIIPLSAENIVDTNGAGDAFVGGFLAMYVKGESILRCVECGNYAASTIIQRSGCTLPEKPEFK